MEDRSMFLGYINVKFNCISKGHSRVVSEAYLSNLSLDEDQMLHAWPAIKTERRHSLRNSLQPGWMDLSIRYSKLAHAQWNWREIDSWANSHFQRPLSWTGSIKMPADLKLTLKQCSNRGNYTTLGFHIHWNIFFYLKSLSFLPNITKLRHVCNIGLVSINLDWWFI